MLVEKPPHGNSTPFKTHSFANRLLSLFLNVELMMQCKTSFEFRTYKWGIKSVKYLAY